MGFVNVWITLMVLYVAGDEPNAEIFAGDRQFYNLVVSGITLTEVARVDENGVVH